MQVEFRKISDRMGEQNLRGVPKQKKISKKY